jgi:hypothetical protein
MLTRASTISPIGNTIPRINQVSPIYPQRSLMSAYSSTTPATAGPAGGGYWNPTIGYTGSGWTYPSGGGLQHYNPTTAAGVGPTQVIPGSMTYVNALPDVQAAQQAEALQQPILNQAYSTAMGTRLALFGDPTALPGYTGSSLQDLLGAKALSGIDPSAFDLARANTVNQTTGAFGNSIVAQLYLAGQQARQSAIDAAMAEGGPSGDIGYGVNLAQQKYGNQLFNAIYNQFLAPSNTDLNTWLTGKAKLAQDVLTAIATDKTQVLNNPSAYPTAPSSYPTNKPYTGPVPGATITLPAPTWVPPMVYGSHGALP